MTATQIQFRRGSAAQMATFTGAQGEVVVDTTNKRVVVHDGVTAGGWPMAGLNVANTFTAAQTFAMAAGPLVTLSSQSGAASPTPQTAGGVINTMLQIVGNNTQFVGIEFDSFGSEGNTIVGMTMGGTGASPAATGNGAGMWNLNAGGYDGTSYSVSQASINMVASATWTTSTHETKVMIQATPVGSTTKSLVATFQAGIQVGSPSGGDKGAGTINVATNIFLNNAAYTNPDYALEHYFTGRIERFANNRGAASYRGLLPLDELRAQLRATFRLPGITNEPAGVVERHDIALEKIEEAILYILELDQRLTAQETQLGARSSQ